MVGPNDDVKPGNNIYTFLLIVAFTFMLGGVVLNMMELNQHYGVTFGGIMSPPPGKTGPAPAK